MQNNDTEEYFLLTFKDLVEHLSKNQNLGNGFKVTSQADLFAVLDGELVNLSSDNKKPKNDNSLSTLKFNNFIAILEIVKFNYGLIPYEKITECVFDTAPEEMLYLFTEDLRNYGNEYFSDEEQGNEITKKSFYKIIRHIDLALIQKNKFANLKISEMEDLKRDYEDLNTQYLELKEQAERQYNNMLTQFIAILGIFAAILMGAFGSIHVFTDLFTNAHRLDLGIVLILSSIGASSVILILFFLLNGIAKLTDRSLWSTKKPNGNILEKYPSLVIIHGILIFVSLIGASLQLSNVNLKFAWQGLWWALPIIWIIYLIYAIYKKDFLFIINCIIKVVRKTKLKILCSKRKRMIHKRNKSNK